MEIKEFYHSDNKEYWLEQIKKSDWAAGQYLHELISTNQLKKLCGEDTKVLLLAEEQNLVAFCTFAQQDDVRDTSLSPWVGFVYTFPAYRGNRYMGKLLECAYNMAEADGADHIYISTGETGLYETYGYSLFKIMKNMTGEDSRVYKIDIGRKR